MAGMRKRVDVSRQPPQPGETPQERRTRLSALLADQQAQLRHEAEQRREQKRRREAGTDGPVDS